MTIALALAVVLGTAVGCGGASAPRTTVATGASDPPRGASERVVQLPRHSTGPSELRRRDLPPAGIERQVTFGATGDSYCVPRSRPQIIFDRRGFSAPVPGRDGGFPPLSQLDEPQIGEQFSICMSGFDAHQAIVVTVTDPSGTRQRKTLPPDPHLGGLATWRWSPRPGDPLGTYRVTARQGAVSVAARFHLHPASAPNIAVLTPDRTVEPGDDVEVMLVGFRPRQRVRLDVYGPAMAAPDGFPYTTSVDARVGPDGDAIHHLATAPDDPPGCGVLRVSIPGGILDTLFCIGVE